MGRKKETINPVCGQRLKEVISASPFSQKDFAEAVLHYTPEHLSLIINGKRSLTPELAEKIVSMFPHIRYQWLMGVDDIKTENERVDVMLTKEERSKQLIEELIKLHGYELTTFVNPDSDEERIRVKPPEGVFKTDNSIELMYHESYKRKAARGSSFDATILKDINDYIEMRLAFCFRKAENGAECYGGW